MDIYEKSQGSKLSLSTINDRIKSTGIVMLEECKNIMTPTLFKCGNNHEFMAAPHNILNRGGCKECFLDSRRLTSDVVNEQIKDSGFEMIGEYLGTNIKTRFRCSSGHEWDVRPANIKSGKGCPHCSKYGFDSNKPAWIYLISFENFFKYGITNNLQQRLWTHKHKNGGFKLIHSVYYEDDKIASEWEKSVKIAHGGRFVNKDVCPDGWTETLCPTKLELVRQSMFI